MSLLTTEITFRRGTAAELMASNIVLADGEPAFATDTGALKIGTGLLRWRDLPLANINAAFMFPRFRAEGRGITLTLDQDNNQIVINGTCCDDNPVGDYLRADYSADYSR